MPTESRPGSLSRRDWLKWSSLALGLGAARPLALGQSARKSRELKITEVKVTPVALPDPPILAASGCHGPYFLRSIIEIETDAGLSGIGESYGDRKTLTDLQKAGGIVQGQSAFAYRAFAESLKSYHPAVFAGLEMACLDVIGKATDCRVCDLLGGPVREEVEFAAYLFYRYAADDPRVLSDSRLVDGRGQGDKALDPWGEVRTPERMADMAEGFRKKWGFRVMKLKAGVLPVETELATMAAMAERFGPQTPLRIDPNGRWTVPTAISAAGDLRELNLEYYEDPVSGQNAMADVRTHTRLKLATNSCVSRWHHVEPATRTKPIDIVLGDIYWFGGLSGMTTLGTIAENLGWGLGYHSNNHAGITIRTKSIPHRFSPWGYHSNNHAGITMAAMIHALAATPQLAYAADTHYVWLPEGHDVIEGGHLPLKDGKMTIPRSPGLGVTLDRDQLARVFEAYRKSGMTNRCDDDTMRLFVPGWKRELF